AGRRGAGRIGHERLKVEMISANLELSINGGVGRRAPAETAKPAGGRDLLVAHPAEVGEQRGDLFVDLVGLRNAQRSRLVVRAQRSRPAHLVPTPWRQAARDELDQAVIVVAVFSARVELR